MTSALLDILGPEGAIARRLADKYEHRPQQLEMATAVEEAFAQGHHLLVEAGTGVGKSFAYLLPAIEFAVKQKKRVVISTHTISLQEQLIDKDIPLLQSLYPDEFTAVLVKGRSNYLCRRRLEQTRGRQNYLFDEQRQLDSLWMIEDWANRTGDGSLADLPSIPDRDVWDKVAAEHGNCLGKKCQFYEHCFWQAAKRRMQSGNILVVNHALFFSDLALRMSGVNYLPKYDLLILDEAHTVESVAGDHFGLKLSEYGLRYQLRTLYDRKKGKGLLSMHGSCANDAIRDVVDLHELSEGFFERCIAYHETQGRSNGRIHEPNWAENDLSPKFRDLAKHLKEMLTKLEREEEIAEVTSHANRAAMTAETIDAIIQQKLPEAVYWLDVSGRTPKRVTLNAAPINVAEGLRKYLFEKMHSVVMTSATLCTAGSAPKRRSPAPMESTEPEVDPAFAYIKSRLGVVKEKTLQLGSPFQYEQQATLYIEEDLPEPNDTNRFMPAACEKIVKYLRQTSGGAFVLFTSYKMLIDAANRLKDTIEGDGFPLLVQGQNAPRKILLERFRSSENAVLFGTASFWQGIDVQGDSLRNVIIVKLPFAVPDEPIVEARLEVIQREGGNPFMEYSVPEAIIKLKQGFGRLIRSKTDRGIVVLLDSRVTSKRYGKLFLDALPGCRRVVVSAHAGAAAGRLIRPKTWRGSRARVPRQPTSAPRSRKDLR